MHANWPLLAGHGVRRRRVGGSGSMSEASREFFLPEFCRIRTLFVVVVIVQLLVFLLVLAQPAGVDRWAALSLYSLYLQWVALASSVLLCLARPWLRRLAVLPAALAAAGVILLVTALVTEAAWQALEGGPAFSREHLLFQGRALGMAGIIVALVLRYFYVQHAWRSRLEAESQARIAALQARIRPHFLFNSLNTIVSMIRHRPAQAEEAVEDLAALFRAGLNADGGFTSIRQELELVSDYLRLERLRLGERLEARWSVDELPRDALLPPLTLQPLLENAIYHGVEPRTEGGVITIKGGRKGRRVWLQIRNPLAPGSRSGGMGMAQRNVEERLRLAFGDGVDFQAAELDGDYALTLAFPYRTGGA